MYYKFSQRKRGRENCNADCGSSSDEQTTQSGCSLYVILGKKHTHPKRKSIEIPGMEGRGVGI